MTQPQPLALPCHTVLGSLTECEDRGEAVRTLRSLGCDCIGSGSFSYVYETPHAGRVVKLTRPDKGSLATLEAALAHPNNPHLPTVYGFIDLPDGSKAIEVEELETCGYDDFDRFSSQTGLGEVYSEPDLDDCASDEVREALAALTERARYYGVRWDDHQGNVMVRPSDGSIVFTDLLYERSALNGGYFDDDDDEDECNCTDCRIARGSIEPEPEEEPEPECSGCQWTNCHACHPEPAAPEPCSLTLSLPLAA